MTRTKRDHVLRAAARLLLQHGVPDLTVQEVANELGISKGSAYYHMGSKEEMTFAILMAGAAEMIAQIEEIVQHPLSPTDRLRLCFRVSTRAASEDGMPRVAIQLPSAINILTPEHRAEYTAISRAYQKLFEDLIKEGIKAGDWRQDVDVKMTVFAIMGMMQNLGRWYQQGGRLTLEDIADTWWRLILDGLKHHPSGTGGHRSDGLSTSSREQRETKVLETERAK